LRPAATLLTDETSKVATVAGVDVVAAAAAAFSHPSSGARTDDEIHRFADRRDRLLRWGWTEAEAERLAERLVDRDRDIDDRVSCADCRHSRGSICANHKAAGLGSRDVGRFAETLQRCPGFREFVGPATTSETGKGASHGEAWHSSGSTLSPRPRSIAKLPGQVATVDTAVDAPREGREAEKPGPQQNVVDVVHD
jgi:hypothetical protein